ncbi:hypothetical protein FF36_00420 [Frankia torreyi]|uniref:site-specific DNA-methyltransferase (cytosine-N(4)-specific) n=1 Tax=Frankia torreyi TaxID=1856 RepID=A0A0D8BPI7_9ACTN|nr:MULTISPECIES: DNA modification methylase [Frankia]KJE25287.1 hypothetical protein FF36_00420 [Frankia torreyi]KQM07897.1 hypothetical protein FF86_1001153 [Frankia sp. CpI1-P]
MDLGAAPTDVTKPATTGRETLCACQCGQTVVRNATGRPGRFASPACRQRARRRALASAAPVAPFHDDDTVTLYVGQAAQVLRGLPDASVHCVVTSPPYFGLRDYGEPGQIGLERSATRSRGPRRTRYRSR